MFNYNRKMRNSRRILSCCSCSHWIDKNNFSFWFQSKERDIKTKQKKNIVIHCNLLFDVERLSLLVFNPPKKKVDVKSVGLLNFPSNLFIKKLIQMQKNKKNYKWHLLATFNRLYYIFFGTSIEDLGEGQKLTTYRVISLFE
jgi:hypothetical protein